MAVHYRTQAFILSKDNLREADQTFNIYSKDFGKLKILGRAIRKIKSKLRSGMGPFYLSEIEFIQGKSYKTLTDALIIDKFKNIRNDLEKLDVAYKITELTDNLIRGQEPDKKIWNLLNEVFNKLNNWDIENSLKIENCKLKIIYYYFLWNFFALLGYQIDFYNCAVCREKLLPEKLYFNPEQGGITCPKCLTSGVKQIELGVISPEVIKILRLFLKKDWQTLFRLKIPEQYKEKLETISERYLLHIYGLRRNYYGLRRN